MSRYALITGASSGIGMAIAEGLARNGHRMILVARNRENLESIAAELTQRFSLEVLYRVCDLADPFQLSGLMRELEEGDRRIDLLVNAAGVGASGAFIDHDWSAVQRLLELNVVATARLCHGLGAAMARQGHGQILNIASVVAYQPVPWVANYAASKAYVLSLSEALREELGGKGVKVSVLCPGPTRTRFFHNARMSSKSIDNQKLMMLPEEVARIAIRGLQRNQAIIVPGWRNRLMSTLPRLLPRLLVRKAAARISRSLGRT